MQKATQFLSNSSVSVKRFLHFALLDLLLRLSLRHLIDVVWGSLVNKIVKPV